MQLKPLKSQQQKMKQKTPKRSQQNKGIKNTTFRYGSSPKNHTLCSPSSCGLVSVHFSLSLPPYKIY